MKTTVGYLRDNENSISLGLFFTCRDYNFFIENKLKKIIINEGKILHQVSREEVLTKKDIIKRIVELRYLYELRFNKNDNMNNVDIKQVDDLIESFESN